MSTPRASSRCEKAPGVKSLGVLIGKPRSDCASVQPPDACVEKQGYLRHVLRPRNPARGPCLLMLMEEGNHRDLSFCLVHVRGI